MGNYLTLLPLKGVLAPMYISYAHPVTCPMEGSNTSITMTFNLCFTKCEIIPSPQVQKTQNAINEIKKRFYSTNKQANRLNPFLNVKYDLIHVSMLIVRNISALFKYPSYYKLLFKVKNATKCGNISRFGFYINFFVFRLFRL